MQKRSMFFKGEIKPPHIDCSVEQTKPTDTLYDMIYAVDPVTGWPVGDLAIYAGKKANPEVASFIENNLLQPVVGSKPALSIPEEITSKYGKFVTDDDVAFFSPFHYETSEGYKKRINNYFENVRLENQVKKRNSETLSLMKKLESKFKSTLDD